MPRGIRNLRWLQTGRRVWQLEAFRTRYFFGLVSETSDPNCWSWHCFAGQGEEPTAEAAKAKVESFVAPIFRYAQSTTWGENDYALFELHPTEGAVVRAAGSFQHCKHYYERMYYEGKPVVLLDVRPLRKEAA
jgi:hypothetical protein